MKALLVFSAWAAVSVLVGLVLGCILRLCHKGEQPEQAELRPQRAAPVVRSSEQPSDGENIGFDALPDRSSREIDRNAKEL